MILYRAMSYTEYELTIKNNKLVFDSVRTCKWFSDNFKFIKDRVQDGSFHKLNKSDYKIILEFHFSDNDSKKIKKLNKYEYQIKHDMNIKPISIIDISKLKYIKNEKL